MPGADAGERVNISADALGSIFSDAFDYLATDEPLYLTPTGGGGPVLFMHGLRSGDVVTNDQDTMVTNEFIAWTKEPLAMGGTYTYNGQTWTVDSSNYHKAGSNVAPAEQNMPHNYLLRRHQK
jgi:hypothetical protein